MKRFLLVVSLVSCASASHRVVGTTVDQKPRLYIKCRGDIGNCLDEANEVCGGQYEVRSSDGNTTKASFGSDRIECEESLGKVKCTEHKATTFDVFHGHMIADCL